MQMNLGEMLRMAKNGCDDRFHSADNEREAENPLWNKDVSQLVMVILIVTCFSLLLFQTVD